MSTIPASIRESTYNPVGATGPWGVGFPIFDPTGADLVVSLNGVEQTFGAVWTITPGTPETGFFGAATTWPNAVIYSTIPLTGELVIKGLRDPRRVAQFTEGAGVPARDQNAALNILTAVDQEQRRDLDREVATRTAEVAALDGRIDQEITDRQSEVSRLDGRVDQETAERQADVSALDGRLDAAEPVIADVSARAVRVPGGELGVILPPVSERAQRYAAYAVGGAPIAVDPPQAVSLAGPAMFSSALAAMGAVIPAEQQFFVTAGYYDPDDGGGALYAVRNDEPAHGGKIPLAAGRWGELAEIVPGVRQFGAVGNYVSPASPGADDTAAFQAFAAYLKTRGGRGRIEGGRYRLTDDIDFYRPASSGIRIELIGDGEYYSVIVSDFFGAGKSVFKSRDPAGLARSGQTSVFGMSFESVTRTGGRVPCFLDIGGWGESRFDRIRFGASNNTHIRASSIQNVRGSNLTSFFGGKHYLHKPTDGLTFTTTNGGNTITASAAIFSAEDAGLTFNVLSSDGNTNAKYTIAGITSSTVATVVGTTIASAGQKGHFQSAVGTVDIGTDASLLTAASNCFTADDVGQWIYIDGAAAGSYGATHHRCQITEVVAANQVRFSPAATRSVSRQLFAIPVADIYMQSGFGSLLQDTNDFIFDKVQIESFSGVALAMERRSIFARISGKLHGVSSMWGDALASTAHAWLSGVSGEISCVLDGPHNSANRMVFSNQNDTLSIPWISSRMFRNETLFRVDEFTSPGGLVAIHDLTTYSFRTDAMLLVADANAERRLQFVGPVNMLGDSALSRNYLGGSTFADLAGRISLGGSTAFADYLLSLANSSAARMLFERIGSRRYSIGNNVGTSWTLRDETAALDRLLMLATGALTPGADGTQALGANTARWSAVYSSLHALSEGVVEPGAVAGMAVLFIAGDGSLKLKRSNGTVQTVAVT